MSLALELCAPFVSEAHSAEYLPPECHGECSLCSVPCEADRCSDCRTELATGMHEHADYWGPLYLARYTINGARVWVCLYDTDYAGADFWGVACVVRVETEPGHYETILDWPADRNPIGVPHGAEYAETLAYAVDAVSRPRKAFDVHANFWLRRNGAELARQTAECPDYL